MSAVNAHGLTPQQERFAQEVARGNPLAQAYRLAYPKSLKWKRETLWPAASELMANCKVSARVEALQEAAAKNATVDAAKVLRELWRVASSDPRKLFDKAGKPVAPHRLPDDVAAAVARVIVSELGAVSYVLWDKNPALDKLMRTLGLYEKDHQQRADPLKELARALLGNTVGPAGLALGDGGR